LVLNATNTYTGTAMNAAGSLLINGFQPQSPIVLTGGLLGGTGTVGTVTKLGALAATVAPGASPGILSTSNATFTSPTTFAVELSGTTPGTGYDQLNVNGTVTLSNAFLSTSLGLDPPVGTAYTIINNDGTDAVLGTFNARPEGSIASVGGKPFQITYPGGTGNDVVLTRLGSSLTFTSIARMMNAQGLLQATGGLSGFDYTIQAATNLTGPIQWSNIGSAIASGAGTISFTDTNAPAVPQRFYRLRWP
jgi:fibronectin-binding autotransporter adhesin